MSNGHAPGIKFKSKLVGITPEGVVSFKADDAQRVIRYFSEYPTAEYDVTATVVGDAGSAGDLPETPESGA